MPLYEYDRLTSKTTATLSLSCSCPYIRGGVFHHLTSKIEKQRLRRSKQKTKQFILTSRRIAQVFDQ